MTEDHDLADRLLAKMKGLVGNNATTQEAAAAKRAVLEKLEAVVANLATHVRLENQILFPQAIHQEESRQPPDCD